MKLLTRNGKKHQIKREFSDIIQVARRYANNLIEKRIDELDINSELFDVKNQIIQNEIIKEVFNFKNIKNEQKKDIAKGN